MEQILLSTAYLPNIQYISKFNRNKYSTLIEAHENFQKQSFRNRTQIMSSQGTLDLTIPVIWSNHTPIQDVRIDHREPWQKAHTRAIRSAYGSSAYWEYLEERIMNILHSKHEFLFDYNCFALEQILDILSLKDSRISLSTEYIAPQDLTNTVDMRNSISPKVKNQRPDPDFICPQYYQVFSEKMPFAQNLSIIDMMFCDLPTARNLIK